MPNVADKLAEEIALAEKELEDIKEQLENNAEYAEESDGAYASETTARSADATGAGGLPAEVTLDEEEGADEDEPLAAFQDWSRQRAALDDELREQLEARLATVNAVNEELEEREAVLRRVSEARQSVGHVAAVPILREIRTRRKLQRRILAAIKRLLNEVMSDINNSPRSMTIQRLVDMLYSRMMREAGDPYVAVTANMDPQHLTLLHRARIITFAGNTGEERVRMVDLAPNLEEEKIAPEEPEESESPVSSTD